MRIEINEQPDINYPTSISWGGDIKGSARNLTVDGVKCKVGDNVKLFNEWNEELFRGMVYSVSYNQEIGQESFTAYDEARRLNMNKLNKVFTNTFPSQIAKNVLGEIKVNAGTFPKDVAKMTYTAFNKTAYEIILEAYTRQSFQDKKKYSIVSDLGKIDVIEQGVLIPNIALEEKINIRSSKYSKSIENIVNQVLIFKTEKGKPQILGKKRDEESIKKYGIFQGLVEEDANKNNILNGKNSLEKEEETANLTVDGHNDLIAGYSVAVKEPNTGLNGVFYIEKDTHTWIAGDYYVELDLAFENVMDSLQIESAKKTKGKKRKLQKGADVPKNAGGVFDWQLTQ